MNRVNLIGRITNKPELRYTTNGIAFTRFNIAINQGYGDNKKTDFIPIIVWKKQAENVCQYLDKGSQVGIEGRIQTGSYDDKDGKKVYTFDVVVDNITFLDSKKTQENEQVSSYDIPVTKPVEEYDPYANFGEQISLDDADID
jgi:single-strand DNA-binding protein